MGAEQGRWGEGGCRQWRGGHKTFVASSHLKAFCANFQLWLSNSSISNNNNKKSKKQKKRKKKSKNNNNNKQNAKASSEQKFFVAQNYENPFVDI